jgi:uncharacterized protein YndB with AHSA1/START domain
MSSLITPYGTLEKLGDHGRVTFVRELKHSREKVWRAITEPEQLKVWFPTTIEGERATGAALTFRFPFPDAPVLEGTMLTCEPPSVMEFMWATDLLRIELEEIEGGTRLTLSDTFPEYEKAARDSGGWHACLDRMQFHIDEEPWPYENDGDGRWKEVTPWYMEHYPKEATTAPIPDFHPDAAEMNS